MVIGFMAISSQMRDDYSMRTKVAEAVTFLKSVAESELNCGNDESSQGMADIEDSKPEIFSSVNYEMTEHDSINVVGTFNNVKGESGKLRIKQGRKFTLNCACADTAIQCKRGFTDINKNLIPHIAAKK
jgi:hypothetical protein